MDPLDPLERELRDLLTDERLALPTHLVGLDRVRAGVTRRRRRRAAVTAAAAVLVTGAVAGSATLAHGIYLDTETPAASSSGPTRGTESTPTPDTSASAVEPVVPGPAWGDAHVLSVTATSTRTVVALGQLSRACAPTCLRLAETHDGGRTWSAMPLPEGASAVDAADGSGAATADSVRFGSATDGWVYGGGLWATHDGGYSWGRLALPGRVSDLEAASRRAWALVDTGNGDHQQLWTATVSDDDWQRVADVEVTGPAGLAVQGTRVVVLGNGQSPAWTNVSGRFERVPNPCAGSVESRLSGSGSLWATCVTGTAAYLTTSTDGGATWTTVPTDPSRGSLPNSVVVGSRSASDAIVWLGDTGLAHLSADGTLTPVKDIGTGISWLGFTDPKVGYAVTCCSIGTLARTDDGGDTWQVLDITTG